jgi:hypothetical protein
MIYGGLRADRGGGKGEKLRRLAGSEAVWGKPAIISGVPAKILGVPETAAGVPGMAAGVPRMTESIPATAQGGSTSIQEDEREAV